MMASNDTCCKVGFLNKNGGFELGNIQNCRVAFAEHCGSMNHDYDFDILQQQYQFVPLFVIIKMVQMLQSTYIEGVPVPVSLRLEDNLPLDVVLAEETAKMHGDKLTTEAESSPASASPTPLSPITSAHITTREANKVRAIKVSDLLDAADHCDILVRNGSVVVRQQRISDGLSGLIL